MNQISCLYLNARSLIGKFDLFSTWVQHFVPDVIGITETWATVDIFDLSWLYRDMICLGVIDLFIELVVE